MDPLGDSSDHEDGDCDALDSPGQDHGVSTQKCKEQEKLEKDDDAEKVSTTIDETTPKTMSSRRDQKIPTHCPIKTWD
jgi:hypothetical protein